MILDDNAEFRQPLTRKYMEKKTTELEKIARNFGFSFVVLFLQPDKNKKSIIPPKINLVFNSLIIACLCGT